MVRASALKDCPLRVVDRLVRGEVEEARAQSRLVQPNRRCCMSLCRDMRSATILGPTGRPFLSKPSVLVVPGPSDVAAYRQRQRELVELLPDLIDLVESRAIRDVIRQLRTLGGCPFPSSPRATGVILETCAYEWRGDGAQPVRRFADRVRATHPELAAMLPAARPGVFRLQEHLTHDAVHFHDAVTDDEVVLLDDWPGRARMQEGTWLVARLAPLGPFRMLVGRSVIADDPSLEPLVHAAVSAIERARVRGASPREVSLRIALLAIELAEARRLDELDYDEEDEDVDPADDLDDEVERDDLAPWDVDAEQERAPPPGAVPVRAGPKIGRNAPCPCGSGRKYKRCCGFRTG